MNPLFEIKISYHKIAGSGIERKITESYLVDALSFTEAEARIIEEIRPYISGEFTIADIKRARISELFFNENGDRYYKVKVFFVTLDEKSGAEKKTAVQMLAQASTVKEAIDVIDKGMEGTMSDYVIASVTETAIIDVFSFASDSCNEIMVEFEGEKTKVNKSVLNQKTFEIGFGDLVVWFENRTDGIFAFNAGHYKDDTAKDRCVGKPLKYMAHEKG